MFFQEPPRLANTYRSDVAMREHLQRLLPGEVLAEVEPELDRMGEAAAGELLRLPSRPRRRRRGWCSTTPGAGAWTASR
jgi:hypothetical protein